MCPYFAKLRHYCTVIRSQVLYVAECLAMVGKGLIERIENKEKFWASSNKTDGSTKDGTTTNLTYACEKNKRKHFERGGLSTK